MGVSQINPPCSINCNLREVLNKVELEVVLNGFLAWHPRKPLTGTRDFKIQRRDGDKNVAKKVNFRSFSLYSDYSYPLTLSIVGEPSRSWIFKGPNSSSEREINFRRCLFTSSIKREIYRHFHVVVVQKRERNVQICVMHVRSLNLLFFWRSRCRPRRWILKSILTASFAIVWVALSTLFWRSLNVLPKFYPLLLVKIGRPWCDSTRKTPPEERKPDWRDLQCGISFFVYRLYDSTEDIQ